MAPRRKTAVFLLLLIVTFPPFLSERPTCVRISVQPSGSPANDPQLPYVLPDLSTTRLLLSPTFLPYLTLMVGLFLLATAAILELLLKLVFVGCTIGVHCFTASQDFPTPYYLRQGPGKSRYVPCCNCNCIHLCSC